MFTREALSLLMNSADPDTIYEIVDQLNVCISFFSFDGKMVVIGPYVQSEYSEKNIEQDGERITILLPDPKVVMTSSKINQKEVREYVGLTRSHFTDQELTDYEQQGRQAILNSVPELGIVQMAQENAARVLVPMLTEMGYREENITIAFRKNLDIMQLINSNLEKK